MEHTTWLKQSDTPLFEQLDWDKPERRDHAGKLLIVGGNVNALTAPAQSYMLAESLGIGRQKVCLPSKTKRVIGDAPFDALFIPSTPSGEFAKDGIHDLLSYALWSDTVLLPGDIGRNSQTTLLLDELVRSYSGQIVLTQDALDALSNDTDLLFKRPKTTLIASIAQLQRLVKNVKLNIPITFTMDLTKLVALLAELTSASPVAIVTLHQSQFVCATAGKVSTTKCSSSDDETRPWRNSFATHAACLQTWYPEKQFEALTHCAYLLK